MKSNVNQTNRVDALTGIAYALPVVPVLILMTTNNVLSGIYATHHGLSLSAISMVMLIAGLFDAFTDPTIGYLSDRYHLRTGSRRPFVIGGALLLIPCAWFLLNPGDGVTVTYFVSWYLLFYLAATIFQIPHLTWGGEISPISEEKTKVYGYRNYAGYAGMIIFMLIPILPFYEGSEVTPETMRYLVIVAAVLLVPTLFMMLRFVPVSVHRFDQTRKNENPFLAIRALAFNKPLMLFLTVSVIYSLALAFYTGLFFMVLDAYLGQGQYYVYLLLFHLVVATLSIRPAVVLIKRMGKINAWVIALALSAIAFMTMPLVLLNSAYTLYMLLLFNIIFSFSSAIGNVAIFSLLSDISDYGTLKSGVDRSATCFSLQSLSGKTCMAIGISFSIGLASQLGFDPVAESHNHQIYWGLTLCMGIIPAVLSAIAGVLAKRISITEYRYAIIRRRLDARAVLTERKAAQKIEPVHNQATGLVEV